MELIKQPNGKYCSVNYDGNFIFNNYTEEEIVKMYIVMANDDMENSEHYGVIVERFLNNNKEMNNDLLKYLGFEQSWEELIKHIPRMPLNITIYAKCPACGKMVVDGIGETDKKCRHCGQMLKWEL